MLQLLKAAEKQNWKLTKQQLQTFIYSSISSTFDTWHLYFNIKEN